MYAQFKEALAIHRQKPGLNHGVKASRELINNFLIVDIELQLSVYIRL